MAIIQNTMSLDVHCWDCLAKI